LRRSSIGQRVAAQTEVQPAWASGAKILVVGLDEDAWLAAGTGAHLSSYHVVVSPDDLDEVTRVLREIPCSQRPRAKVGVPTVALPKPDRVVLFQDISDDGLFACSSHTNPPPPADAASDTLANSETSSSSSFTSDDLFAQQAWHEAVRAAVTNAQRVHINVRHTFVDPPESVSAPSLPSRHTI